MADSPQMEIPDSLRQMAERNVDQARAASVQFMQMVRQAQDVATRSSGAMAGAAGDLQAKSMRFAEQNIEAGFQLATELARARDMKEYFEIQIRHAQRQMQAYAQQAQELGRLIAEMAQRAQSKS